MEGLFERFFRYKYDWLYKFNFIFETHNPVGSPSRNWSVNYVRLKKWVSILTVRYLNRKFLFTAVSISSARIYCFPFFKATNVISVYIGYKCELAHRSFPPPSRFVILQLCDNFIRPNFDITTRATCWTSIENSIDIHSVDSSITVYNKTLIIWIKIRIYSRLFVLKDIQRTETIKDTGSEFNSVLENLKVFFLTFDDFLGTFLN